VYLCFLKQRKLDKVINSLRPSRIIFPILIGIGVSGWLLYHNFNREAFSFVQFSWHTLLFIVIAFSMMLVRDVAYMYRIIILTDNRLSWKQAFNIIMLWEFSSAVSPSVVGGTAPAIFFLYKEGLSGKVPQWCSQPFFWMKFFLLFPFRCYFFFIAITFFRRRPSIFHKLFMAFIRDSGLFLCTPCFLLMLYLSIRICLNHLFRGYFFSP